jgi:hypothetical protein
MLGLLFLPHIIIIIIIIIISFLQEQMLWKVIGFKIKENVRTAWWDILGILDFGVENEGKDKT